jgi:hypothetical protein
MILDGTHALIERLFLKRFLLRDVTGGCYWTQVVIRLFPYRAIDAISKSVIDGASSGTHERAIDLDRDGYEDVPGDRVLPWSSSSRPGQRVVGQHCCEGFAGRNV